MEPTSPQGAQALLDTLMQWENLSTMAATAVLLATAKRVLPKLHKHSVWQRCLPLLPLIMCSIAVWIPGIQPEEMSVGSRITLGIILGAGTGQAHKILKQTGFNGIGPNGEKPPPKVTPDA